MKLRLQLSVLFFLIAAQVSPLHAQAQAAPEKSKIICDHAAPPRGMHYVCKSQCDCHLEGKLTNDEEGTGLSPIAETSAKLAVQDARPLPKSRLILTLRLPPELRVRAELNIRPESRVRNALDPDISFAPFDPKTGRTISEMDSPRAGINGEIVLSPGKLRWMRKTLSLWSFYSFRKLHLPPGNYKLWADCVDTNGKVVAESNDVDLALSK